MIQWEYGVESFSMADRWSEKARKQELDNLRGRLKEWGDLGWELISYESVPMYGTVSSKLKGYAYLLLFKRPSEQPSV